MSENGANDAVQTTVEFKHLFHGDLTAERMVALGKDGWTLVTNPQMLNAVLQQSLFFGRAISQEPIDLTQQSDDNLEILPDNVVPLFGLREDMFEGAD